MADEPQQPEQDESTEEQSEQDAAAAQEERPAPAEEPAAEEQPAEEQPAPAEEPAAEAAPAAEPGAAKKPDLPPGADLDPIALEPEQQNLSAEERARLEAEAEERARREAEISEGGGAEEEPAAAPAPARMESGSSYQATGKRKSSIARVTLVPGNGEIVINQRPLDEYFPRPLHRTMARQPLSATGYETLVDIRIRVHGGGISGQAGAVRHGIARALTTVDPELRGDLKRRGYLTRDARVKERRKAGLKKARKRPQFSKR
jgi:small subunit ribosomal protein S9